MPVQNRVLLAMDRGLVLPADFDDGVGANRGSSRQGRILRTCPPGAGRRGGARRRPPLIISRLLVKERVTREDMLAAVAAALATLFD